MAAPGSAPFPNHTLSEPLPLCLGPWTRLHTQTPNWKDGPKSKQASYHSPYPGLYGQGQELGFLLLGSQEPSERDRQPVSPCLAMPSLLLTLLQDSTLENRHRWAICSPCTSLRKELPITGLSKRCQKVTESRQTGPTLQDSSQTTVPVAPS